MTKLPLKQVLLNMYLGAFSYFHAGLLVIIKLTKGRFSILLSIKHYLQTENGWRVQRTRHRKGYAYALRAMRETSLGG